MKIGLCGVPGSGKTEFVNSFVKQWPIYDSVFLNQNLSSMSQEAILNALIDLVMVGNGGNIIWDGCVIDPLCHFITDCAKNEDNPEYKSTIQNKIQKMFHLTRQALHFYDIIFYIPASTKFNKVKTSEIEGKQYDIFELDCFYKQIYDGYTAGENWLFPFDEPGGAPAMIDLFGTTDERIQLAKMYIGDDGAQNQNSVLIR